MAYFAISKGSLVLLLNLKGMIMSVLILSPNIQAFPFVMLIDDGGCCPCSSLIVIESTSLDQLFYLQLQMLPPLQEMPSTLLRKAHPFSQQNSLRMMICKFHFRLKHQDEYQHMLHR